MAGNQVLTFRLGETDYGLGILHIQEIRCWTTVTRIPDAPPRILGVLNLRGAVVPIIDLRRRFGQSDPAFTPLTVIIVLSLGSAGDHRECGLVVDGVSDVIELQPDATRPAPPLLQTPAASFIDGIATVDDRMLILLKLDALIGEDLHTADAARSSAFQTIQPPCPAAA